MAEVAGERGVESRHDVRARAGSFQSVAGVIKSLRVQHWFSRSFPIAQINVGLLSLLRLTGGLRPDVATSPLIRDLADARLRSTTGYQLLTPSGPAFYAVGFP